MISQRVKKKATKIASAYNGTFYMMDLVGIQNSILSVRSAWRLFFPDIEIAYSYKTNSLITVTKMMLKHQLCAEVTSGEELNFALDDGFCGNQIYFDGPLKHPEELCQAILVGASIQVDSLQELMEIENVSMSLGIKSNVLIRLSTQYKNQEYSRFGLTRHEAIKAIDYVGQSRFINSCGFHIHVGSNVNNPEIYCAAIERYTDLFKIMASHLEKFTLNIGGGYPAASVKGNSAALPATMFAKKISNTLKKHGLGTDKTKLVIEPGRCLVEDHGYLVSPIRVIKQRKKTTILILDGGIHLVKSLHHWKHSVEFVREDGNKNKPYEVYGSNCFESDLFHKNLIGPSNISLDDLVIVSEAGGYDIPSANVWTRISPPIYGITNHQECVTIRRPQEWRDMRSRQVHFPSWIS